MVNRNLIRNLEDDPSFDEMFNTATAGILEVEEEIVQSEHGFDVNKIVEGRMNKYYEEFCLYEQPFIKDNTVTIQDLIKAKIAKLGEKIAVARFVRFKVGGGQTDEAPAE